MSSVRCLGYLLECLARKNWGSEIRSTGGVLVGVILLAACGGSLPSEDEAYTTLSDFEAVLSTLSEEAVGEHDAQWHRDVEPVCGIIEGGAVISQLQIPGSYPLNEATASFVFALEAADGEILHVGDQSSDIVTSQFGLPERPVGEMHPFFEWEEGQVSFHWSICCGPPGT